MKLPKIDRLSWKLGLASAAIVIACQGVSFFLVQNFVFSLLIDKSREHFVVETALISQALERQMLEKDYRMMRELVDNFAREKSFERVMILNREGEVNFSSDPEIQGSHFSQDSPTCRVCHSKPPEARTRTTVLETGTGDVLRCVLPVLNRPACHGCHDPSHRINGLVVVDASLGGTMRAIRRTIVVLGVATSVVGLLLLMGMGYVVRNLLLKRLYRFEAATCSLASGDLESRVPVEGNDSLTRLENQFNTMADSLCSALAQLRQQRASLNRVLNSVDDGMVVLDPERKIVAANDAFLKRFGVDRHELTGRKCYADHDGDGRCSGEARGASCPALACFDSGAAQVALRTRVLADGSTRQEEVLASPVLSDDGTVTHVVEVWRDITERRSAEARMAEYQRLVSLGMLASGFSHEVNTPLASIGTCIDGIRRLLKSGSMGSGPDRTTMVELADIAATQVQRCGGITHQFLQLARGEAFSLEAVSLEQCVSTAVRLSRHKAEASGIRVDVAGCPPASSVLANAAAVLQVLLNLVMNAIEACQPGGRVEISFATAPAPAIIVQDDGCGISQEDVASIFEPFFTRKKRGTGLGLFVSLNLARRWGGDIEVKSQAGRGTTFTVTFSGMPEREGMADNVQSDSRGRR